jgi:hypothetical protein
VFGLGVRVVEGILTVLRHIIFFIVKVSPQKTKANSMNSKII